MRSYKKILGAVIIILLLAILGLFSYEDIHYPGQVQGTASWYQLKSSLPVCSFNGSKFLETPCYVPPHTAYD